MTEQPSAEQGQGADVNAAHQAVQKRPASGEVVEKKEKLHAQWQILARPNDLGDYGFVDEAVGEAFHTEGTKENREV